MKKTLVLLLSFALLFLSGCDIIPSHDDAISLAGITHEPSTNHSKFILNGFEGKYQVKLDREGLDDGAIYYSVRLTEGSVTISYDLGAIHSPEPLFTGTEAVSSYGGYVFGDTVYIIIESSSAARGTVEIDFEGPINP